LNDSQQRAQQHGRFLKVSPVLMCLRSVVAAARATTAVVADQVAVLHSNQALPSPEQ
jgi:hypothetical protein